MEWSADPTLYPPYLRSRIRRGRGVGVGANYSPWIKARDVPSRGTSSVVRGVRSGRLHYFLSEYETIYFFLLERRSNTCDIREQWPILDIDRTLELCKSRRVHHPYRKGVPEPFTIDFLITEYVPNGTAYRAATIKTPEDAMDPRVRTRLSIERDWLSEKGTPYFLVDTSEFSRTLLNSLRFIRAWYRQRFVPEVTQSLEFSEAFRQKYSPNYTLGHQISTLARQMHLSLEGAQDLFRYCVWQGLFPVDLRERIALDLPIRCIERSGQL